MKLAVLASLALPLALSACAFDGNTDFFGPQDVGDESQPDGDGSGDGVQDPASPDDPGQPGEPVFFAVTEETRHGTVLEGSLADVVAVDGRFEIIESEQDRKDEKLEHRWHFEGIPSGQYTLGMVAIPFSPNEVDSFVVEVSYEDVRGHIDALELEATGELMVYEGELFIDDAGGLDVKVKLPKGAKPGDDAEEGEDLRRIDVDALSLTRIAAP